jgi:hypothetical protein
MSIRRSRFVDLECETICSDGAGGSRQERLFMRFMYIVTSARPTPELVEAMHKLADREIKAGRMIDSGGLMPLAAGTHVRVRGGQLSVVDGPIVEAKR